ncbi:MAG: hypothetical protein WDN06_12740 [Asticcacaulis sp.]
MTDRELEAALKETLGIMGGSGGPGELDILYQGAGLKIWAGWEVCGIRDKPVFQGAATIRMAREVYSIHQPGDTQLALF